MRREISTAPLILISRLHPSARSHQNTPTKSSILCVISVTMNRFLTSARPVLGASRSLRFPASVAVSSPSAVRFSSHEAETFQDFSKRYTAFFETAEDLFELQRGLNNCFAHDLVPAPEVIEAALRAARRVDDYSTAVRIFEGVKEKVENKKQYDAYLDELKGVRDELGQS